jgi:hypothetical protein
MRRVASLGDMHRKGSVEKIGRGRDAVASNEGDLAPVKLLAILDSTHPDLGV